MVDNNDPYQIYIFSPLVSKNITKHEIDDMLQIIVHEVVHTFVTEINGRCFSWMNEGICEFASGAVYNKKVEQNSWEWFRNNDVFIDTEIGWDCLMDHQGYAISFRLMSYIIDRCGKDAVFDLLRVKRVPSKDMKNKISKILGSDLDKLLDDFEFTINTRGYSLIMDIILGKIAKELEDFFEITAPDFGLTLISSREEFDKIICKKSEPWMAGFTRDGNIYTIHPDKIEELTIHKKESYLPRLKHEMSHIFYVKCANGSDRPSWLNEGLAYYLADQPKWNLIGEQKLLAVEYFTNFDGKAYGPGEYMVRTLIEKYGKEKILQLISGISKNITQADFNKLFKKVYGFNFNKDELKKIIVT